MNGPKRPQTIPTTSPQNSPGWKPVSDAKPLNHDTWNDRDHRSKAVMALRHIIKVCEMAQMDIDSPVTLLRAKEDILTNLTEFEKARQSNLAAHAEAHKDIQESSKASVKK